MTNPENTETLSIVGALLAAPAVWRSKQRPYDTETFKRFSHKQAQPPLHGGSLARGCLQNVYKGRDEN